MLEITLSIPDHLYRTMKRHHRIRWDEVVRRLLSRAVDDLDAMERTASRSLLTTEDVDELDHLLKAALGRRYLRPPNP